MHEQGFKASSTGLVHGMPPEPCVVVILGVAGDLARTTRDRWQRLTRLGAVVFSWTPLQARPPDAHEITSHRAVAPMPVGLPMAVVLYHALPSGQERRNAPASIRQGSPGPPHGRGTETAIGECGDDRTAALEQATTEQRPQEVEKA